MPLHLLLALPSRDQFFLLGVTVLIAFLAYSSQLFLLHRLEPFLSTRSQTLFNILVACIWISYYRAYTTNPGGIPRNWDVLVGVAESGSDLNVPSNSYAGARSLQQQQQQQQDDNDVDNSGIGSNGVVGARAGETAVYDADVGQKDSRRWCAKCEMTKPPRSRHCKQCKQCVGSIQSPKRRMILPLPGSREGGFGSTPFLK